MAHNDSLVTVAHQFARDVTAIADVDELLWYAATKMVAPLGFDDCVIYRIDRNTGFLKQVAAYGDKATTPGEIDNYLEIPIGHGLTGFVAMTGESIVVDDVRDDPRYVADLEFLRSEVATPIVLGSSVFGVIDCESPQVAAFDTTDLDLLKMIAYLIAPKIEMLMYRSAHSSTRQELVEQNLYLSSQLETAQNAARTAEHLQATTTLMQLSGGVAHDFNNQLAVMRGALDMVAHREQGLHPDLAMIGSAIERATELTHRLLAFSSQQALFPNCINLAQVLNAMQGLLQVSMGSWITINTAISDDLWNVNIDLGQLENAILNLAVNARDAMPDGGSLKISCYNAELVAGSMPAELDLDPGEYVVLTIADHGHGMNPDVRVRAFEPYFTTKTRGNGTGLGLSMVYGFVRQSGGDAIITSVEGEGTAATLYFPRDRSNAAPVADTAAPQCIHPGSGEVVLVIDDNLQLGQAVAKMLEVIDYTPLVATTAAQAIEFAKRRDDIAAVLSDVVLDDGWSGPDLCEVIAAEIEAVPVIFMSGYADLGNRRLDERIERQPFLQKPFSLRNLAATLRESLTSATIHHRSADQRSA